jgi:hypothetical protein
MLFADALLTIPQVFPSCSSEPHFACVWIALDAHRCREYATGSNSSRVDSLGVFLPVRVTQPCYSVALPWAALLLIDEFVDVKDLCVFQHVVDCAPQAMGHNPFGLVLPILVFHTPDIRLCLTGFPQKQHHSF